MLINKFDLKQAQRFNVLSLTDCRWNTGMKCFKHCFEILFRFILFLLWSICGVISFWARQGPFGAGRNLPWWWIVVEGFSSVTVTKERTIKLFIGFWTLEPWTANHLTLHNRSAASVLSLNLEVSKFNLCQVVVEFFGG